MDALSGQIIDTTGVAEKALGLSQIRKSFVKRSWGKDWFIALPSKWEAIKRSWKARFIRLRPILMGGAIRFCWFFFIAIFLGQLGSAMSLFGAWWDDPGQLSRALSGQIASGNFVVFTTALLASSAFFLVKEYIRGGQIERSSLKSLLLLFAVGLGLAGTLVAFKLMGSESEVSSNQLIVHWIIYGGSLLVAVLLWFLEEKESPKKFIEGLNAGAETITVQAEEAKTTASGVKI